MNKRFKKLTKIVFIFTLIFSWIFSGWPQVWPLGEFKTGKIQIPPKVKQVFAATQIKTAGTVSSVRGGGGYSDCTNNSWADEGGSFQADLMSADNSEAYITHSGFDSGDKSHVLTFSNFGFDLPTNSTIDGVEVSILRRSNGGANGTGKDYHLQLTKTAGTPVASSDDKAATGTNWPSTLGTETYGGASDKWSVASWSEAEIENSGFGLVFAAEASADNADIWIDQIQITVHYTPSSNTLPVASLTSIDNDASNVTLTENTTTNVVCEATVTDADGFANITSVEARLYETTQGAAGTADENYRYILTGDEECIPSGGSGNTENYACTFAVQFFANPADNWTCQITPTDTVGAGTADSDTIIVDATNALAVAASIVYGDMGLGTNSESSPIAVLVTNTGNTVMDPQVSSSADMSCATGTIPVANQKYAASTFTYSSGGVTLSGTDETLNLDLPKPTVADPPVTDNSYWGILIPATGVKGACTGSNTFTAIAGS